MLYNLSGNLINVSEIASVQCYRGKNPNYPYSLAITLKNSQRFTAEYQSEQNRSSDVQRLKSAFDKLEPVPVTQWDVERIVDDAVKKIKADMRRILKEKGVGE